MESEASINTDSYVQKCGLVNTELNNTEPGSAESVSLPKSSHEREKSIWLWLENQPTIKIERFEEKKQLNEINTPSTEDCFSEDVSSATLAMFSGKKKPKRTSSVLGSPISLHSGSTKRSRSDQSLRTPVSQSTILSPKSASRVRQDNQSVSSKETITDDTEVPERRTSVRGFADRDPYKPLSSPNDSESEPPSADLTQSISSRTAVYVKNCWAKIREKMGYTLKTDFEFNPE